MESDHTGAHQSAGAQISNGAVHLVRAYTGRGLTKARTTINPDLVTTSRRVIAFMSDHHLDPDLAAETFVREPMTGTATTRVDAALVCPPDG